MPPGAQAQTLLASGGFLLFAFRQLAGQSRDLQNTEMAYAHREPDRYVFAFARSC